VRYITQQETPEEEEGFDDQTCDVGELLARIEATHIDEEEGQSGNGESPSA
jgi:hypothetical protein